jgi:hypothetical protein
MVDFRFLGEQSIENILNDLDMFSNIIQRYLSLLTNRNKTNE